MLSFKNVKISKNSNEVDVDFEIVGQECLKADTSKEYDGYFKNVKGFVVIDSGYTKNNVKERLNNFPVLNERVIKEALLDTLNELQYEYKKLKNHNFCFEVEEFTSNSLETLSMNFGTISNVEKSPFFDKSFNINDLNIEDNPFSEKLKNFLLRFKDGRYQETVYIYNNISPEEYTEAIGCKYDLFGVKYEVLDQTTHRDKVIYKTIPVQILCRIFNITPYQLFECSADAFSRVEYEKIKNN